MSDIEELQKKIAELEREKKYLSAQNEVLKKENEKMTFRVNLVDNIKAAGDKIARPALLAGRFAAYAVAGPAAFLTRQLLWPSSTLRPYTNRHGEVEYHKPYIMTTLVCAAFWFGANHVDKDIMAGRLDSEIETALAGVPCVTGKEPAMGTTKCDNIFLDSQTVSPLFGRHAGKFIINRTQDITIENLVNTKGESGHLKCRTETTQINRINKNDVVQGEQVTHPQVCAFLP